MSTASNLIDRPIPCAQCGYDLRGTAIGGACPECGLRVLATKSGIRADGKFLVIKTDAILPKRCIKTNQPVDDPPVTRKLYWAPPWVFVLILVNLIVLLIVYMIVRKECRVTYYISREQKNRRRIKLAAGWGVFVLSIITFGVGVGNEWPILAVASALAWLASIIALIMFANVIAPTKHKDGEFWIKGVCQEYLDEVRSQTVTA